VVLVGDSSTGKTRALWEAIQHLPAAWRLWAPANAKALSMALDNGSVGPETVLWLDDAQAYINPAFGSLAADNAVGMRELLGSQDAGPVLVLATLWQSHWSDFTAQPRGGRPSDPGEQTAVSALLAGAICIAVPPAFAGDDLAAVRVAAQHHRFKPRRFA